MIDGMVARALKQQSNLGAKLDSIADVSFLLAIVILIAPKIVIPLWIWILIGGIALIRITSYFVGYMKFRTFSSLHTYANKATGATLFIIPILYFIFGSTIAIILPGLLAFVSACEELLITVLYNNFNRDRTSIFEH